MSCLFFSMLILASAARSVPPPPSSYAAAALKQSTHGDLQPPLTSSLDLDQLPQNCDFCQKSQFSDPDYLQTQSFSMAPSQKYQVGSVWEKWQKQVPNILEEIKRDPSFRTRARLGLSYFPSTFDSVGWNAGIEDLFLARIGSTGLTISGDYQASFTGQRKAGGAVLRYYLLPLGGYVNLAPVLGYRYLETPRYTTDGVNVGLRAQLVPSRTGATDLSLTQTWVAPRTSEEVGVTMLSFGYALTKQLRLSTDIEKQNSRHAKDTRFAIALEWMF
jgi:hypothetical protein